MGEQGFRPISVFAYPDGIAVKYGIVFQNNGYEPDCDFYHCEDLDEFSERVRRMSERGFRPDRLVAYSEGDACRYMGIWVEEHDHVTSLVKTGTMPEELAALDDFMERFMVERSIPAGSIAVIKDGHVVGARGYGFIDRDRTTPTSPDTPFRIGPLTEVFTRAAVAELVAQGKLTLATKVMPLLGVSNEFDAGWSEITVSHLLEHQAGWDPRVALDPIFDTHDIAEKGLIRLPPTTGDLIDFMATQPLQYRPGSDTQHSEFGYSVLGEVVAKVSGKSYADFVTEELLKPLGLQSIRAGRTLPRSRPATEPYYSHQNFGHNVIESSGSKYVPRPDGTFALEAATASLGLIGSATDVAKFFLHYDFNGQSGDQMKSHSRWAFFPGSFAVSRVRSDGIIFVALFNQNRDSTGLSYHPLLDTLDGAIDEIAEWPTSVNQ
ncbi:MAG: beta-lactamase family protein [Planctomycetaceae bacterium]|nr:beta-lactamase family protein [Planctomycetaceae bacterium]